MKILAITSHYPPFHVGGYEIRCKNVVDQLLIRGHDVEIITNRVPGNLARTNTEPNIFRAFDLLDSSSGTIARLFRDIVDVRFLHKRVSSFKPDVVYLWNVVNFTRAIFPYLAETKIPVVYDEGGLGLGNCWHHGGSWYSWLEQPSPVRCTSAVKGLSGFAVQKLSGNLMKPRWKWPERMTIYFNSEQGKRQALDQGIPVQDSPVLYSGLELRLFSFRVRSRINKSVHILVPGRIQPTKGQLDAVNLLALLKQNEIAAKVTIVGKVFSDVYAQEIVDQVGVLGLKDFVNILPMVSQDVLTRLYQDADICFFPSYQQYGLSRTPLEAMACGALVIAYGGEGSGEIILDQGTGYIVQPQDYQQMEAIIQQHITQPELYQKMTENARQAVEQFYSLDVYTDKIEAILLGSLEMP